MRLLILMSIFSILLVTLLANPAPLSIEIDDLVLIAVPSALALLCLLIRRNYKIYKTESHLLIALILYLSYLMISILIAFTEGVPIFTILRSIGPYINFFPIFIIGMLPARMLNPWWVAYVFILVGIFQAIYQIKLYYLHSFTVTNTLDVLRNRITLLEPRTTLPLILSVAILPLTFLSYRKLSIKILAIILISLGFFAGAATLTRSVILSIIVGWLAYMILYLYVQSQINSFTLWVGLRRFSLYLLLAVIAISIMSFIPKINALEQGILARFGSSSLSTSADYSNGRLYDEWLPALKIWANSGIFSLFFGIGAGNTFTVMTGEERTYIHNLSIYTLVYGGLFGFFTNLWLYYTVLKIFVFRAFQAGTVIYLGFAALLITIFCYGQFFAVHKGLAYNAMLFLMITTALCQPANITKGMGEYKDVRN